MSKKTTIANSIQDKHLEVHYDEKTTKTNNGPVPVRLQGKIQCPVLNYQPVETIVWAGFPVHPVGGQRREKVFFCLLSSRSVVGFLIGNLSIPVCRRY